MSSKLRASGDRDSEERDAAGMLAASHRRQEEELAACQDAAQALAQGRGHGEQVELIASVLAFLRKQAKRHVADEEESVFPRLGDSGAHGALVRTLMAEHREHEEMLSELESLAASWSQDAVPTPAQASRFAERLESFCQHYQRHIQREDAELLSAVDMLSEAEKQAIIEEMAARRPGGGQRRGQGGGGGGGGQGRGQGGGGGGGGQGRGQGGGQGRNR